MGGFTPFSSRSSCLRRSPSVCLRRSVAPSARRSNATYQAGVASLSILTLDSAGWIRCWRAPKSRPPLPTTISSPSRTTLSDLRVRNAGSSSGKYRVMGRAPRLISSTWSWSLKTRVRKPSHLGSYSQLSPAGTPSPGAESIGSMSSGIGSFKLFVPRCLYLVEAHTLCYHIGGHTGPPNSTPRPHPSLGKLAQAGFPLFGARAALLGHPLEQVGHRQVPVVLAQDGLRRLPDGPGGGRPAVGQVVELQGAVELDVGHAEQLLAKPLRPCVGVAVA